MVSINGGEGRITVKEQGATGCPKKKGQSGWGFLLLPKRKNDDA